MSQRNLINYPKRNREHIQTGSKQHFKRRQRDRMNPNKKSIKLRDNLHEVRS